MSGKNTDSQALDEATRSIASHAGIVDAHTVRGKTAIEIEYDPAALDEDKLRRIAEVHSPASSLKKRTLRLESDACEACAIRLEKKVKKIPGVKKATATYIGQILCLTFDENASDESTLMRRLKETGARVAEYRLAFDTGEESLWRRISSGTLNNEVACATGLLFLILSFASERLVGQASVGTWLLYAGAYFFCGQQGVRSAIASLRERVLDVDVLMVLAAIGAALVGQPFEGALLLFLFSLSNVLQSYALQRTRNAIHSLLKLRPENALLKRDGTTVTVPVGDLQVGDVFVLRPGGHVPVDGTVIEGRGYVDESSLTGESLPVSKESGSKLFAGTLNQSGGLEVRVDARAEDSTLARMVKLVEEAQAEKSKTQRFLEQAEQYYATGVIVFTALVFLVPLFFMHEAFDVAFYRAMTVMVVASPCALVISTPATVLSAIGGAARRGILIKGGAHLEQASHVDIVAFDKTGTLTSGKPVVTAVIDTQGIHEPSSGIPESLRPLVAATAALEEKSEHPLARAILDCASRLGIPLPSASDFQSLAGKGAEATVDGRRIVVGSARFFTELRATGMPDLANRAASFANRGHTCVWIGIRNGDQVAAHAILTLADTLRPESKAMVQRLHELGVKKVVILTGDQESVALSIAKEAGIDAVHAELLPEGKVAAIRELKKQGRVMMVGDGVNDAPALAASDLGVAMGAAGTDIAMETADIVLMGDKLENIPLLLGIARHARRVLWQNLVFATSVIILLLAATFSIDLALPIGVLGHEGSTVLVCLNGLRLLVHKPA